MLQIGMLWLDDTPHRSLAEKVRRAAAYYRQKYGQEPNVCYVHPSMLPEGMRAVDGIAVRPLGDILPQHLWLGVAEAGKVGLQESKSLPARLSAFAA